MTPVDKYSPSACSVLASPEAGPMAVFPMEAEPVAARTSSRSPRTGTCSSNLVCSTWNGAPTNRIERSDACPTVAVIPLGPHCSVRAGIESDSKVASTPTLPWAGTVGTAPDHTAVHF